MIELHEFHGRPPLDAEGLVLAVLEVLRREPATAARSAAETERALREVCNAGIGLRPGVAAPLQVREALNGTLLRLASASLTSIAAEMQRRPDEASQRMLTDALVARLRSATVRPRLEPEPVSQPAPSTGARIDEEERRHASSTRPGRPRADDSVAGTLDALREQALAAPEVAAGPTGGQLLHRFVVADGVELIVHDRAWQAIARSGRQVDLVRSVRDAVQGVRGDEGS